MWDVREDGFDSMDIENVGLLEIADLSLEAVLFDPEGNASI